MPPNETFLPFCFVICINSSLEGKVKYKASYVIVFLRDNFKNFVVQYTTTLQPQSVRLLLVLGGIFMFDIWKSNILQSHIQVTEALQRDIFIKNPVLDFNRAQKTWMMLLELLYGLFDAGNLWHTTLDKHHKNYLVMIPFQTVR